jgi:hypothetical protein
MERPLEAMQEERGRIRAFSALRIRWCDTIKRARAWLPRPRCRNRARNLGTVGEGEGRTRGAGPVRGPRETVVGLGNEGPVHVPPRRRGITPPSRVDGHRPITPHRLPSRGPVQSTPRALRRRRAGPCRQPNCRRRPDPVPLLGPLEAAMTSRLAF